MRRPSDAVERALKRARANPRQLWLPGVAGAPERPPSKLSRSIETARQRRQAAEKGNVAGPPQRALTERERFAFELHCLREEWAADGGDGSVCSTDEGDPPTLNLEWLINGALLEVMAAVVMRPEPARVSSGRQPEDSMEPAE